MKACKCGSYAINHHCHGRDGTDGDLCDVCYWRKRAELRYSNVAPQPASEWVPVTQALLDDKPNWFYQPLWIAMDHGEIYQGYYEWRQGRYPDKFISDGGLDWVFNATHVMPVVKPTHPAHKENTCPTTP